MVKCTSFEVFWKKKKKTWFRTRSLQYTVNSLLISKTGDKYLSIDFLYYKPMLDSICVNTSCDTFSLLVGSNIFNPIPRLFEKGTNPKDHHSAAPFRLWEWKKPEAAACKAYVEDLAFRRHPD